MFNHSMTSITFNVIVLYPMTWYVTINDIISCCIQCHCMLQSITLSATINDIICYVQCHYQLHLMTFNAIICYIQCHLLHSIIFMCYIQCHYLFHSLTVHVTLNNIMLQSMTLSVAFNFIISHIQCHYMLHSMTIYVTINNIICYNQWHLLHLMKC